MTAATLEIPQAARPFAYRSEQALPLQHRKSPRVFPGRAGAAASFARIASLPQSRSAAIWSVFAPRFRNRPERRYERK